MGMEMKISLKVTQRLVMTPMLQQAIKLLPLARLELAQLVRQEIIENPVLEETLDSDDEDDPDSLPDSEDDYDGDEKSQDSDASLDETVDEEYKEIQDTETPTMDSAIESNPEDANHD